MEEGGIDPDGTWRIIAPTETGPQAHDTGGEMAIWISRDQGAAWKRRRVTSDSPHNHGYARRPVSAHPDFYAFWADGSPEAFSVSRLYFMNRNGDKVWRMPYEMEGPFATPEPVFRD